MIIPAANRFKLIASLYLILIRDGKVLLMRRKDTGFEDGNYGLPSGHLEDGESLTQGMCREAKEELGITLQPKDLHLVHVMHRRQIDIRLDFFFNTEQKYEEPKNCEPEKCDDLQWFPLEALPPNTIDYIRRTLQEHHHGKLFSEIGWDKD